MLVTQYAGDEETQNAGLDPGPQRVEVPQARRISDGTKRLLCQLLLAKGEEEAYAM